MVFKKRWFMVLLLLLAAPRFLVAESGTEQVPLDPGLTRWGENPFLEERQRRLSAVGEKEGGLVLYGILWDPHAPSALINDRVLNPGDPIGRWKVVEIQKDRVVVSDGPTTQTLEVQ